MPKPIPPDPKLVFEVRCDCWIGVGGGLAWNEIGWAVITGEDGGAGGSGVCVPGRP